MLKKLLLLVPIISITFLAGCADIGFTVGDAVKLAAQAKINDALIQDGRPQKIILTADINEAEADIVIDARDSWIEFVDSWQAGLSDVDVVLDDIASFSLDVGELVAKYEAAYAVPASHWDEYSSVEQRWLTGFHEDMVRMHDDVMLLMNAGELNETLQVIMGYGDVVRLLLEHT